MKLFSRPKPEEKKKGNMKRCPYQRTESFRKVYKLPEERNPSNDFDDTKKVAEETDEKKPKKFSGRDSAPGIAREAKIESMLEESSALLSILESSNALPQSSENRQHRKSISTDGTNSVGEDEAYYTIKELSQVSYDDHKHGYNSDGDETCKSFGEMSGETHYYELSHSPRPEPTKPRRYNESRRTQRSTRSYSSRSSCGSHSSADSNFSGNSHGESICDDDTVVEWSLRDYNRELSR